MTFVKKIEEYGTNFRKSSISYTREKTGEREKERERRVENNRNYRELQKCNVLEKDGDCQTDHVRND